MGEWGEGDRDRIGTTSDRIGIATYRIGITCDRIHKTESCYGSSRCCIVITRDRIHKSRRHNAVADRRIGIATPRDFVTLPARHEGD